MGAVCSQCFTQCFGAGYYKFGEDGDEKEVPMGPPLKVGKHRCVTLARVRSCADLILTCSLRLGKGIGEGNFSFVFQGAPFQP